MEWRKPGRRERSRWQRRQIQPGEFWRCSWVAPHSDFFIGGLRRKYALQFLQRFGGALFDIFAEHFVGQTFVSDDDLSRGIGRFYELDGDASDRGADHRGV